MPVVSNSQRQLETHERQVENSERIWAYQWLQEEARARPASCIHRVQGQTRYPEAPRFNRCSLRGLLVVTSNAVLVDTS
jgi:hypothetical protein